MIYKGVYSFQTAGKITAGIDSIENLAEVIEDARPTRAAVITDKGVRDAGIIDRPVLLLKDAEVETHVFSDIDSEPDTRQVDSLVGRVRPGGFDIIVGIGGGSVMDTAKLISVLLTNTAVTEDIIGSDKIEKKGVPLLLVPTTAGTGSEVTPNAIVSIAGKGIKKAAVSPRLIPGYVILDPSLTVKMPSHVTASTGMDAFTHAFECYISKKANPLSDMFALRAIKLIYRSIIKAYENGEDLEARNDMLTGSMLAGMCIAASGTAAVHALAYPLGGRYGIPHGVSNAMLLPHVVKFNLPAIEDRMKDMAVAAGLKVSGLTKKAVAEKFAANIQKLIFDLDIPQDLKEFGIEKNDIDAISKAALSVKRLIENNPREIDLDSIKGIYGRLF